MRATILSVLLTLASALPAAAQDKAKPNTLTPKEIADGWILLFDGETTFGWRTRTFKADLPSNATVKDGLLVLPGSGNSFPYPFVTTRFHHFELRFDYLNSRGRDSVSNLGINFSDKGDMCFLLRNVAVDTWHFIWVQVGPKAIDQDFGLLYGGKRTDPLLSAHRLADIRVVPGVGDKTASVFLRDVKLRPLSTKHVFNGKDLTGWKTFPGKKSQFTVEDGAIHLKNGPGDLQTEGKYANFVLQLECKSNGKHLNSGVFFRCKANEYQNGYEAQIHNNFTADPAKEYSVEEFDPKTHELVEKKKVKSAATDYGTGAIYRRVPARSGVAKDGEWFTMTIVAHGNHFATWVNGIQQVDWYDIRPASDNPRTGFRKEAGHISIQGHDPTTDLSFRNIRIAELPN
jgi:Domain of Unknown Function (DUF1080)